MSEPRGTMTSDDFLRWVDEHPSWPPHAFEEPCGQMEGTDHCWLCGSARLAHPEPALTGTPGAEVEGLRDQVLDLGGRPDGFDHWRSKASSKPSDPDDVRWECSCGYAGSPDTVRRHWAAMQTSPSPAGPDLREAAEGLRALSDAATPGPWTSLTHGTASQYDAAQRAAQAVMAVRLPDAPDIQFTDLSWIDTADPNGPHIGMTGNGPTSSANAKVIVAAVNFLRSALQEGR